MTDMDPEHVEAWAAALAKNGRPGLADLIRAQAAKIARLRAALDRLVQATEDMAMTVNCGMADEAIAEGRAALAPVVTPPAA